MALIYDLYNYKLLFFKKLHENVETLTTMLLDHKDLQMKVDCS